MGQRVFTKKYLRRGSDSSRCHYYSKERIEILSKMISIILAATFIVVPIAVIVDLMGWKNKAFWVIIGFIIAFAFFLAVGTKLKPHEIFAVEAAYAAVLVVFLSNIQSGNGNCDCKTK
jgi:hypothetical protein